MAPCQRHRELVPDEEDEWEERVDELRDLLDQGDDEGVLAWFAREYPACLQLVPRRRRRQFLKGVYAAREEGRV